MPDDERVNYVVMIFKLQDRITIGSTRVDQFSTFVNLYYTSPEPAAHKAQLVVSGSIE